MNITAKSRYALKIMMDLAITNDLQKRQDISERQSIPIDFMDAIISRLKSQNLIRTSRGRLGGLELAKELNEISVWDIFLAVEDHFYPVKCLKEECSLEDTCISNEVWSDVFGAIKERLTDMTLKSIISSKAL